MIYIHFFALLFLFLGFLLYKKFFTIEKLKNPLYLSLDMKTVLLVFILCFFIRLISATFYAGYPSDFTTFYFWSIRIAKEGFSNFYSPHIFTDYPPGYMYVLFLLGKIFTTFNITSQSIAGILLLKQPAIICDLI
ncbi:MAG: hypothetical protein ACRC5H_03820, partial [Treponemataceae bacterium]